MAMLTIPNTVWPPLAQYSAGAPPVITGGSAFLLNSADERIATILRAPKAGNIRTVHVRTATINTGATVDLRVETVDLSTGDPTGTLVNANANAALVIANGDDDVVKSVTLTADAVVTRGQRIAIVTVNPAVSFLNGAFSGVAFWPGVGEPYNDAFSGTWVKGNASDSTQMIALEYSDGSFVQILGVTPPGTITTTTINTGSTPDAIGARFRLPYSARVIGAVVWANVTADINFRLVETAYNQGAATGILASALLDPQCRRAALQWIYPVQFDAEVTLQANTYYRLIAEPASGSNISVYDQAVVNLAMLDAFCSQDFHLTTAKDPTGDGSWTNFNSGTFRAPYMALIINGIDAGGGGGGTAFGGRSVIS